MITISGYLHRNELNDIVQRWMYGRLLPTDADLITRLIYFNSVFVHRFLQGYSERILRRLYGDRLCQKPVSWKGELKDMIIAAPPYINPRVEELISLYRSHPDQFYRETPFNGTLFFIPDNGRRMYIGSNRIKRVRRLAEKCARRIIDRIFAVIQQQANSLAEVRARQRGIDYRELISTPEEMAAEFARAEGGILEGLRMGKSFLEKEDIVINDLAGIKIVLEEPPRERLYPIIEGIAGCEIIEEQVHQGNYRATNLMVRCCPQKELILAAPLGERILQLMQARGLSPSETAALFQEFVLSGEESVMMEIIVSNYQEMLESEIGRCMHEERIIAQRQCQQYNGQLSKNIEFLMEYLFTFPFSGRDQISALPIYLWYRYLPDYFGDVMKQLLGIPAVEILD